MTTCEECKFCREVCGGNSAAFGVTWGRCKESSPHIDTPDPRGNYFGQWPLVVRIGEACGKFWAKEEGVMTFDGALEIVELEVGFRRENGDQIEINIWRCAHCDEWFVELKGPAKKRDLLGSSMEGMKAAVIAAGEALVARQRAKREI